SGAEDPERHYITHELPAKLGFDLDYLRRRSLGYDLTLVLRTVLLVTGLGKRLPASASSGDAPAIVTAPRGRGVSGDETLPLPMIRDSATAEAAEPLKEGWFTPQRVPT